MAKKKKAVYRRSRTDKFAHPKTGGMHLASYGLMDFAWSQNILGVLQMSPRAIAAKCGAMQVREVIRAIGELTSPARPGLAIWWEELEVLWIVEALDEQSDGAKMDASAARLLVTLPPVVQAAIIARYGERVSPRGDGGLFSQRSEIRDQETENRDTPTPRDEIDLSAERVLTHLNLVRSEGVPGSDLGDTQWIRKVLEARPKGEAECLLVLDHLAHEAREKADWQWVNSSTPFHLKHFERRLADAQNWAAKRKRVARPEVFTPPGGITREELNRVLGEPD